MQTAAAKKNAKKKKQSAALSNLSLLDEALSEAAASAAAKARAADSTQHIPTFRTATSRAVLECAPATSCPRCLRVCTSMGTLWTRHARTQLPCPAVLWLLACAHGLPLRATCSGVTGQREYHPWQAATC